MFARIQNTIEYLIFVIFRITILDNYFRIFSLVNFGDLSFHPNIDAAFAFRISESDVFSEQFFNVIMK